jgi:sulfopyruvate decarboxylase TPP-binding subunit
VGECSILSNFLANTHLKFFAVTIPCQSIKNTYQYITTHPDVTCAQKTTRSGEVISSDDDFGREVTQASYHNILASDSMIVLRSGLHCRILLLKGLKMRYNMNYAYISTLQNFLPGLPAHGGKNLYYVSDLG